MKDSGWRAECRLPSVMDVIVGLRSGRRVPVIRDRRGRYGGAPPASASSRSLQWVLRPRPPGGRGGIIRRMPASVPAAPALSTALRAHGVLRRYPRGTALFAEGDLGDRVFLVERGWVVIRSAAADGSEIVLALRGPGEVLGELS